MARQANPKKYDYVVYKNDVAIADGTISSMNMGDATHAAWNKHVKGSLREVIPSPGFYRGVGHGAVADTRVEVRPHAKSSRRRNSDEDITDDPRYDTFEEAIEQYVERHAELDAAAALSTVDDETMIELERQGFDDQDVVSIAEFGREEAVNGDILVSPFWERELGIKKDVTHPVTWREARFAKPLYKWLQENGYEKTNRGGKWPGGMETEIDIDSMAHHLAGTPQDRKFVREVVEHLVEKRKLYVHDSMIYSESGSGDHKVYARRAVSANPHRGKKRGRKSKRARNPNTAHERQIAARLAQG